MFDTINKNAKVAFIQGKPTKLDWARKSSFHGKSIEAFFNLAMSHGIFHQTATKITAIHDNLSDFKHLPQEAKNLAKRKIFDQLKDTNVNVIVALGSVALEILTDDPDIETYRGSVTWAELGDQKYKVLPIIHPEGEKFFRFKKGKKVKELCETMSYIRDPKLRPVMDFDMQKLHRNHATPHTIEEHVEIEITQDIAKLRDEYLCKSFLEGSDSFLSYDIECYNQYLTVFGFAPTYDKAIVIPVVHVPNQKIGITYQFIRELLATEVPKVLQNGNFDISYMNYHYGIPTRNFDYDTMLAMHCLFPQLPKNLGFQCSILTDAEFWKNEKGGDKGAGDFKQQVKQTFDWNTFFRYNGKDCANTARLMRSQKPLLKAFGVEEVFRKEMRLCEPLMAMSLHGVKADMSKKGEVSKQLEHKIARHELFLANLVTEDKEFTTTEQMVKLLETKPPKIPLNVQSPKQLSKYIYSDVKLPRRVKKGKLTTDKEAMITLIPHGKELMQMIHYLRTTKKQKSFYDVKLSPDGRIRTQFKPAGTETGRLASSKFIDDSGNNLQNQPKPVRVFFVADEGYLLLQADYGKAESWVVAHYAQDDKMIEALGGEDFHSVNAANILGKPVTKANYGDRQLGKKISHAANYRMTEHRMATSLQLEGYDFTKKQCRALLDTYFETYPGVQGFQAESIRLLKDNNMTLNNAFGRRITYFMHWGNDLFNAACAYRPQSTVGDMTNYGLQNIYDNLRDIPGAILLQVHDSVIMQIRKDYITPETIERIRECMTIPITIKGVTFTVPIDIEIGENWLDLQDDKKFFEQNSYLT